MRLSKFHEMFSSVCFLIDGAEEYSIFSDFRDPMIIFSDVRDPI